MPGWDWLIAVAVFGVVLFALLGCASLPSTLTIKTSTGTTLATVDVETGDVVLTPAAMRLLVRR